VTVAEDELRCPVCQAQFRGTVACSRCGADLRRLMRLTVCAHAARQAARGALRDGAPARASALLRWAQACRQTSAGTRLLLLSQRQCRGPGRVTPQQV
jgi:hypothetical protein